MNKKPATDKGESQDYQQGFYFNKIRGVSGSTNALFVGFTLIEVLIVVAILAILAVLALFFYPRHVMRARDAQRKSDIKEMRIAFEEYYNDHRCYPPQEYLVTCGHDGLSPYLKEVPCDPLTKEPYLYQVLSSDACSGYRLLADLEINDDPDVTGIGCDPKEGCGGVDDPDYNWGVAVGASVSYDSWVFGDMPDGYNYCVPSSGGGYSCNGLSAESLMTQFKCPKAYPPAQDDLCVNECQGPSEPPIDVKCLCREGATHFVCN